MDRLLAGQQLIPGQELVSLRDWFRLALGSDGSVAVYRTLTRYSSLLAPASGTGATLVMQGDGNFVAYGANGAYWATGTDGHPGAYVVMQDDGNLVVYGPNNVALWASNTVQDMAALVVHTRDSRGYTYNQTSESLKEFARALPCFLAMQWPGYTTGIVEDRINGEPVVIQWWKGWCQNFLGFLPASPLPGGVGGEVGVYRRIPGKARPASLPFLPPLVAGDLLSRIAHLTDEDLWWPAPDLGAEIEFKLINPVTGTEFFSGEKQRGYWLAKWMDDQSFAQYRRDVGIINPTMPEWFPGNSRTPADPSDFIMQFTVNGKIYPSLPPGLPVPRAQGLCPITGVSRARDTLDIFAAPAGVVRTAGWKPAFNDGWHGGWDIAGPRLPGGTSIQVVSRSTDKLDIFAADETGRILTAAWEPGFTDGWHGWHAIRDGRAAPGAVVSAASRSADKLDVFVTGTDGQVYTAAWEPGFTDGWHGWWPIAGVSVPQGAPIQVAVSRLDTLSLFCTAIDGRVMTSSWSPVQATWAPWTQVLDGRAAPGAPVTAVSSAPGQIDLFVTGLDGRAYTARQPARRRGGAPWSGWVAIGDARLPQGAPINAVSRSRGKLDIFATDLMGRVISAAWSPEGAQGWKGWWQIAGGQALPGAAVAAVSRAPDKLDIFVTGIDGIATTAAWEPSFGGAWHGWWKIPGF